MRDFSLLVEIQIGFDEDFVEVDINEIKEDFTAIELDEHTRISSEK